jgi:hypothetical protein
VTYFSNPHGGAPFLRPKKIRLNLCCRLGGPAQRPGMGPNLGPAALMQEEEQRLCGLLLSPLY